MDFFEAIKSRRSIRVYAETPVESEKLDQILEAVNQAPSAGNLQAFEIYIVTREDRRASLAEAAFQQEFLAQSPVVLVFCAHAERSQGKYGQRGAELYALQDATIACTYAMLAATALGLATVWVGAFEEDKVSRVIQAPEGHHPVAMLPVGYAAEAPGISTRRDLDDLTHHVS